MPDINIPNKTQQRARECTKDLLDFRLFTHYSTANPTIASYNANVVKIYSAVNSMARF
jgi:hypothetical protein